METTTVPDTLPDRPEARQPARLRRIVHLAVLLVVPFWAVWALGFQNYYVPTGSMAPALRGEHRACACPTCGNRVVVGKHPTEKEQASPGRYLKAFCPWCGAGDLHITDAPTLGGDRVRVHRFAYMVRRPRRWEIIVLEILGEHYIKRILGLPGDQLLIVDGDIYIHGELLRKTWGEMAAMRVALFDQSLSGPDAWRQRWERDGEVSADLGQRGPADLDMNALSASLSIGYRNFSYGEGKCTPLIDEQAYNGGLHAHWETVHDFSIETEIETIAGAGVLALSLTDGQDLVELELPVGAAGRSRLGLRSPANASVLVERESPALPARCKLEFAFVDRRIGVRLNGDELFEPIDLPAARGRLPVTRPLRLRAEGVHVRLEGLRLYRDVHYTQAGSNGVKGQPVLLGRDEYFVLGDNSGRSEDSRFWPNRGVVPGKAIVGRVSR